MSRFFIDRPIFAWVIALVIMLAGVLAIFCFTRSAVPIYSTTSYQYHRQLSWRFSPDAGR